MALHVLVTAGTTQVPIDRVRAITNIFSGRTGSGIALAARRRGHRVCLLTSAPEVLPESMRGDEPDASWLVRTYRTFGELAELLPERLATDRPDVLIHSAAVSDYESAGLFIHEGGAFRPLDTAGKVASSHSELWVRLRPTPKLVDRVRQPWGFRGILVKFKLEVGRSDEELRYIAMTSRAQSDADLIVANTLEEMRAVAWIGDRSGGWQRVPRLELAGTLLDRVEELAATAGSPGAGPQR